LPLGLLAVIDRGLWTRGIPDARQVSGRIVALPFLVERHATGGGEAECVPRIISRTGFRFLEISDALFRSGRVPVPTIVGSMTQ